jgi:hypothetical protein
MRPIPATTIRPSAAPAQTMYQDQDNGLARSCANPEHAIAPIRRGYDARIMAAACENEGDIRVGEQVDLECRSPGRNVVALGSHGEAWVRSASLGEAQGRSSEPC